MTVIELYRALEAEIPVRFPPETDCDGAQIVPDADREVRRILVSLDPYEYAVRLALRGGYDVLLTHHPLFYFDRVPGSQPDKWGAELERAGVAQFSFHMRLDEREGGVNDLLAARLGLVRVTRFGIDEAPEIGRVGDLPEPLTAAALAARVKAALDAPRVEYTPRTDGEMITRVAVLGGSSSDFLDAAAAAGAQALVGGEFKHHAFGCARGMNLTLVGAGHFCTETPVCAFLADTARRLCPDAVTDLCSVNPTVTL